MTLKEIYIEEAKEIIADRDVFPKKEVIPFNEFNRNNSDYDGYEMSVKGKYLNNLKEYITMTVIDYRNKVRHDDKYADMHGNTILFVKKKLLPKKYFKHEINDK